jgi:hypothetical protein
MNLKTIPLDMDPVLVELSEELQTHLASTAEAFEITGVLPLLTEIIGTSYDIVMWFDHDNGHRYGVITTTQTNKTDEITQEVYWTAYMSYVTFTRQCIKDYLARNKCGMSVVYCLMKKFSYEDE